MSAENNANADHSTDSNASAENNVMLIILPILLVGPKQHQEGQLLAQK